MEYSGDEFDVIVVGAGVMGSSTAYQTAKRGHKTLLLEQFDFLHHRGSSHGESRTIRAT
ncbi:FAD-dependent oxidoreductase, partial [Acinetobacter baumannii]